MKHFSAQSIASRFTARAGARASVIASAMSAASLPLHSFAQGLPTIENPSRGTGSGIMQTLQNYGYDIVLLIALLVVASMFVGVCYHAYTRYAEIHNYPAERVKVVSERDWVVSLDVTADEYHGSEQVKRALVRYPLKVVRQDVDPQRNPFGLALDCYDGTPQRIEVPAPPPAGNTRLDGLGLSQGDLP